jgi:hypothetical protein
LSHKPFHPELDELHHPELEIWRANVGPPIALDVAPPALSNIREIDILSWNLAIGSARLAHLLARLRAGEFGGGGDGKRPLVVLAQEAYRSDDSVPEKPSSRYHGGQGTGTGRTDIVELARAEGLSLRYAPSMRNGAHRSDRGNAILSTVALGTAHAFLLPLVRQRRVVVSTELLGLDGLWLTSAHLDTGGQPRGLSPLGRFGGGRVAQIQSVITRLTSFGEDLVVGADLNTPLGRRDPAVRTLTTGGFQPAQHDVAWTHTFHGPVRLLLDHVMWRSPKSRIRSVRVVRIDESIDDDERRVFGSDHHPLLARVTLAGP